MKTRGFVFTFALLLMVQLVPSALAQQGSVLQDSPDVTVGVVATLIKAANSARVALMCTNTDATSPIRVGSPTVNASRGVRLGPGATLSFTATSAVWGFSEQTAAVIACSEEIR